jgi:hypothetical protein
MKAHFVTLVVALLAVSVAALPWTAPPISGARDVPNWPTTRVRMLFIHHSCGELLWRTYGNLSGALDAINIEPHDATYGDTIGEYTDVCDWYPKFHDQLELILTFNCSSDQYYSSSSGVVNDIVMFKSCFPTSDISGPGSEPGDPESSEKTIANYKAAYNALLSIFRAHPDTLFIAMTAPPLARDGGWTAENGQYAHEFNTWLVNSWTTTDRNIAVFDWFYILANPTDFALKTEYVGADPTDSHPNEAACLATTPIFVDWIDDVIVRWQTGVGTTTIPTSTTPPSVPGFPWTAIVPALATALAVGILIRRRRERAVN